MGITIHYRGRLSPKVKRKEFFAYAKVLCAEHKWKIEGEESEFHILPHENCELLNFRLAGDGSFQDTCKTQFATIEIHIRIVDFFSNLKLKLTELVIRDEGEYWELRNKERLARQLGNCFDEIRKTMDENPDYYGPVRSDDGRIVDLVK